MRAIHARTSVPNAFSSAVSLAAVFDPVYSVREMKMSGAESLCVGYSGISSEEVPSSDLYDKAMENGTADQFDAMCREKALESFMQIPKRPDDFLLFIRMHPSSIDSSENDAESLKKTAEKFKIDPYAIVIVVDESEVQSIDSLIYFTQQYRKLGCLIALDTVGKKGSNLERISLIKPDIISIDNELISSIDELHFKQEVAKALLSLSNRIGALTLAKGIQRTQEAMCCLELGFDMLQGDLFSPQVQAEELSPDTDENIRHLGAQLKEKVQYEINQETADHETKREKIERIAQRLLKKEVKDFAPVLRSALRSSDFIHCLYILDSQGVQVTPTVTVKRMTRKKHRLFGPAASGTDHSLKPYFLQRAQSSGLYYSPPYVSKATGFHCVTASLDFETLSGKLYYLCMDISHHIRNSHNRIVTMETITSH